MSYTVSVSETRSGYITFKTEEEAKEWMEYPEYDEVLWTDQLESDFILIKESIFIFTETDYLVESRHG